MTLSDDRIVAKFENDRRVLSRAGNESIRPHIRAQVTAIRANVIAFVNTAVDAGELAGDAKTIASLIEATYNGALDLWLIERRGTAWSYSNRCSAHS